MPVVSRMIRTARKPYRCDCHRCGGHRYFIHPGERYVRLYGNAHDPDPKYVVRLRLDHEEPSRD